MLRFWVGRIGGAILTLFIAVSVTFFLTRFAGDPVRSILGDFAPEEQVAALRQKLGLDQPILVQYLNYLGGLLRGDLGESWRYGMSTVDVISSRLVATGQLALLTMVIAIAIGVPLGLLAGRYEGSFIDRVASTVALVGISFPGFWIGMIAILIFAVGLGVLPATGGGSWQHIILPASTLALGPIATLTRLTRSATVDVLHESYTIAAEGRGIGMRRIMTRHVPLNVSLPVMSVAGLQLGGLLSGAVTVEIVFGWPGVGQLAVNAVQFRDFPLVSATVVLGAVIYVVINLIVDLLYGVLDPRIRIQG